MDGESAGQGAERSESYWALIDEACSRFETAWQTGQQPRIEDFLPAEAADKSSGALLNLLVQLVGIDLEWRWKTADRAARQQTVAKPSPPAPLPEGEGSKSSPPASHLEGEGSESDSPRPSGAGSQSDSPRPYPGEGQGVRALAMRPRLADYVARYCLLGPVGQLPNDLIADEYYARRRYGDRPTHAEYLDVFGVRHPELAKQLQAMDEGMATAEHLPTDLVSEEGSPLGDMLRRCLAAPASEYLRGLGQSPDFAADSPLQCAAAAMTLGELFQRADPPLGLLIAVKRGARRLLGPGTSSMTADVHHFIYFASIAAAMVRHGQRISKSSPEELRSAWQRLAAESYPDDWLRRLFASAQERF